MTFELLERSKLPQALTEREPQRIRGQSLLGFPPQHSQIWVCWPAELKREIPLPVALIVPDDEVTDFLAWAVTFLSMYRPLTSFMRVIPWSFYDRLKVCEPLSHSDQSLLVGAILGEALSNTTDRSFLEYIPISAFESTYSFALAQAVFLGIDSSIFATLTDAWTRLREVGEQHPRKLSPRALEQVWRVLGRLVRDRRFRYPPLENSTLSLITDACAEIREVGQLSAGSWERLSDGAIRSPVVKGVDAVSKEARVDAFETAAEILSRRALSEQAASFLLGYAASTVSDGTLEHPHLLFPLSDEFTTCLLWYGVCAGLHPRSQMLSANAHLGFKLIRSFERTENIEIPPNCDISYQEFEVIARGQPRSRGFRKKHNSILRVEILPLISTIIRTPARDVSGQMSFFDGDEHISTELTSTLVNVAESLRASLSMIEAQLPRESTAGKMRLRRKR